MGEKHAGQVMLLHGHGQHQQQRQQQWPDGVAIILTYDRAETRPEQWKTRALNHFTRSEKDAASVD